MREFASGITPASADDVELRLRDEILSETHSGTGGGATLLLHEETVEQALHPLLEGVVSTNLIVLSLTYMLSPSYTYKRCIRCQKEW
jgi:hypothetical protein